LPLCIKGVTLTQIVSETSVSSSLLYGLQTETLVDFNIICKGKWRDVYEW